MTVDIVGVGKVPLAGGMSLEDLARGHPPGGRPIAAKVDNEMRELTHVVDGPCTVEYVCLDTIEGNRIYSRGLVFLLIKAADSIFPGEDLTVSHSVRSGLYCEVGGRVLTQAHAKAIEARMRALSSMRIPYVRHLVDKSDLGSYPIKNPRAKAELFRYREDPKVKLYECDGTFDYFYGYMAPHTGYIDEFSVIPYPPGVVLLFPTNYDRAAGREPAFKDQRKLFNVFTEYGKWLRALGVRDVASLNGAAERGELGEVVRVSEALHEKKVASIADAIADGAGARRIVLVSGPSSSGKTTFAKRLTVQLRASLLNPRLISMDDYFRPREETPLDAGGNHDFESIGAIDLELFNGHMETLMAGGEVELPRFDFVSGKRVWDGRTMRLGDDGILMVEGIHGLNDRLTETIPGRNKYRIYVSALTVMNLDGHNRVTTTDTRFLRRIVRDLRTRGVSPEETIMRWPSVRRGEEEGIFPFQENADVMFNSSLIYEFCVIKGLASEALRSVGRDSPAYCEAKRLLKLLGYFVPMEAGEVAGNSILREFIGGGCFGD